MFLPIKSDLNEPLIRFYFNLCIALGSVSIIETACLVLEDVCVVGPNVV